MSKLVMCNSGIEPQVEFSYPQNATTAAPKMEQLFSQTSFVFGRLPRFVVQPDRSTSAPPGSLLES